MSTTYLWEFNQFTIDEQLRFEIAHRSYRYKNVEWNRLVLPKKNLEYLQLKYEEQISKEQEHRGGKSRLELRERAQQSPQLRLLFCAAGLLAV